MFQPVDAYKPQQLKQFEGYKCPSGLGANYLTFNDPAYVFVSGSGGNPCGHCLLMIDSKVGYVHAAQPGKHRALFIPSEEFDFYLHDCRKRVWDYKPIQFQTGLLDAARILTNKFLKDGYGWWPWHDCVTMVDEIATAGGSDYVAKTVFPDKAVKGIHRQNDVLVPGKSLFKQIFPNL